MLETARYEGELKGKLEGELEGRSAANREFTTNRLTNTTFADEKIALLIGVDAAWVAAVRKEVKG
ncbi:MAG TPA: hypothetical protein PKD90_03645 [Phnomibacter sp.]|nr:hypothetical protein [Phnomibacter sp.]